MTPTLVYKGGAVMAWEVSESGNEVCNAAAERTRQNETRPAFRLTGSQEVFRFAIHAPGVVLWGASEAFTTYSYNRIFSRCAVAAAAAASSALA